ncbi:MAG: LptF/LptG family permease [Pseudomonadota bacterium]
MSGALPGLLFRYIARLFSQRVLACIGGLWLLTLLFGIVESFRRASGRDNIAFGDVLQLAALGSVRELPEVLPFAVLLGSILCFDRIARNGEWAAMRGAGVSPLYMLSPAITMILLFGAGFVLLATPLIASAQTQYDRLQNAMFVGSDASMLAQRNGFWLRIADAQDSIILHVDSIDFDSGILQNLRIYRIGDTDLRQQIFAENARSVDTNLHLEQATVYDAARRASTLNDMTIALGVPLAKFRASVRDAQSVSIWQLPATIALLDGAGLSDIAHRQHFHKLLALPFLLCAMMVMVFASASRIAVRTVSLRIPIFAIILGLAFYLFSRIMHSFGSIEAVPLVMASWVPPVSVILASIALVGKWEGG